MSYQGPIAPLIFGWFFVGAIPCGCPIRGDFVMKMFPENDAHDVGQPQGFAPTWAE
jgi:hypothetical protein